MAHCGWNVCYLIPPGLALPHRAAEPLECLLEKGFDVVRLQPPRLRSFHLLADAADAARVHRVVREGVVLEQGLKVSVIQSCVERSGEPCPDLWEVAIADSLDQKIPQRLALKLELAEYIEHLAAKRLAS